MIDAEFERILRKAAAEEKLFSLETNKIKALLSDYTKNQFKKETSLLLSMLDADCIKYINTVAADNVTEFKEKFIKRLDDDYNLSPSKTSEMLDLLLLIIKGIASSNSASDKMAHIPGGTFMMGSPDNEAGRVEDEGPQHKVTVSAFYMGKFEVTQKEYQDIMGVNPGEMEGDNLPVEIIWYDAVEYCNKLSLKEGLNPAYTIDKSRPDPANEIEDEDNWLVIWDKNADGYRLPTEAEWEYACRAGTKTPYNTGNAVTTGQAHFNGEKTKPIGSFAPNSWGLYDMHGNMFEWCWDWHGEYSSGSQTDPSGASSGKYRICRGGDYRSDAVRLRAASRMKEIPEGLDFIFDDTPITGFRLVRSDPQVLKEKPKSAAEEPKKQKKQESSPVKNTAAKKQNLAAVKLQQAAPVTYVTPKTGQVITFGNYKWRVLDVDGDEALIMTVEVIESCPYNKEQAWATWVTWETCSLREYLNNEFLQRFTKEQQARIVEKNISNPDNIWYGTTGGKDTRDKIFLLSLEEADRYFGNSRDYLNRRRQSLERVYQEQTLKHGRLVPVTSNDRGWLKGGRYQTLINSYWRDDDNGDHLTNNHDKARTAYYEGNTFNWWLRSPGSDSNSAAFVDNEGRICVAGCAASLISNTRPVLWLR